MNATYKRCACANELAVPTLRREQRVSDLTVQRDRLKAALESMPQGFRMVDEMGRLTVRNGHFLQMLQLPADVFGHGKIYVDVVSDSLVFGGQVEHGARPYSAEYFAIVWSRSTATVQQLWFDDRTIPTASFGYRHRALRNTGQRVVNSLSSPIMLAQCPRISTRVKLRRSALGVSGVRRRIGRVLLTRREVNVLNNLAELPAPLLDRHCLLRIVVNLTSNARRAINDVAGLRPYITLGAARVSRIAVAEKGEGIAPENLTRIFAHAVTTRENGSGFEMHSGGAGQRSTSTIEIAIDALGGQR